MIVNLWATQRTGSHWYAVYLTTKYKNSVLIPELFSRHLMTMYSYDTDSGHVNVSSYEPGYYYWDCTIENGQAVPVKVYAERTRNLAQEEEYRINLLTDIINSNTVHVLNNHVEPINARAKQFLTDNGENYYIYRRDRGAQLGSYAIAMATKRFFKFSDNPEDTTVITETPLNSLDELVERIRVWDTTSKDGVIIAYEDIVFTDHDGWPRKQISDYRRRLSPQILEYIDNLVAEYEKTHA